MKKATAMAMALVLMTMMGGAALAESPVEALPETPALTEFVQESASNWYDWIGQGWQTVTDTVENGWNTVVGTITDHADTVESYMTEKDWPEEVRTALETIKTSAEEAGSVAADEVTGAYHTVRAWMKEKGEQIDQSVASALDQMAGAAGVVEAEISGWYRTVECFVVSSAETVNETVLDAWNTIRSGAEEVGKVSSEQMSAAWDTFTGWFETQNVPVDSDVAVAVEELKEYTTNEEVNTVEIMNDYSNTAELLKSFPVVHPTSVEEGIEANIQNRLLTGFENWNRGFDAWKAWGDILYTPDSIYNVHGARLTLGEYQAAMNATLSQVDIKMGDFHNMIICDDWTAIRYDITTIAGSHEIPGSVMEFVKFADFGDPLGTRVVEGWGGPKDSGYTGMAMFQSDDSKAIQLEQDAALIAWEIPQTDNLAEKYPVLNPTTDKSEWTEEIRAALLMEFDAWNQGYDAWAAAANSFYADDALCAGSDDVQKSVSEYKTDIAAQFKRETTTRKYFDSMLISGDWAATHYRTVTAYHETGETVCADRMQFFRFVMTDDGIRVVESWLK